MSGNRSVHGTGLHCRAPSHRRSYQPSPAAVPAAFPRERTRSPARARAGSRGGLTTPTSRPAFERAGCGFTDATPPLPAVLDTYGLRIGATKDLTLVGLDISRNGPNMIHGRHGLGIIGDNGLSVGAALRP